MKISELFYSVQGEGIRTGVLSAWIRFASCNLRCKGFYQEHPTKPETYKDPLAKCLDPKKYNSIFELPVVEYGCDTIYAIDPRFKHLFLDYTVEEVVRQIRHLLPNGSWVHPNTMNMIDLCITGGEPMLWQNDMIQILDELRPSTIQIETNGTKLPSKEFIEWYENNSVTVCWNISPKLYNVSGEKDETSWKPDVISALYNVGYYGCLKFVVNDTNEAWDELNKKVRFLNSNGVTLPVYIMPVGATYEQQTNTEVLAKIASRAVNEGYHISSRLQSVLWGNGVGV